MSNFDNFEALFKPHSGVIECHCNCPYVPDEPESVAEHAIEHAKWEHSVGAQGRSPVGWAEREKMKDAGRERLRNGASVLERAAGGEEMLRSYFHRSLEEANGRGFGFKHPTEGAFLRVAAEANVLENIEISDVIAARYEFVPLPDGQIVHTSWEPSPVGDGLLVED